MSGFKIICLNTQTELDYVYYNNCTAQEVVDSERDEHLEQSDNIWAVCDSDRAYELAEMENEEPSILSNVESLYEEAIKLGILHPETLETFEDYLY